MWGVYSLLWDTVHVHKVAEYYKQFYKISKVLYLFKLSGQWATEPLDFYLQIVCIIEQTCT